MASARPDVEIYRRHEALKIEVLLLVGRENSIDRCATNRALALHSRLAIFHGNALPILHFRLCFALYAIKQVCQGFLPPTLEKMYILFVGINSTCQEYLVSLSMQTLLRRSSNV